MRLATFNKVVLYALLSVRHKMYEKKPKKNKI